MDSIQLSEDQKWQMLMLGSAVAAAVVVRGGIRLAWKASRDDEPPMNPMRREADWSDAVLFSIATGATVGLARLAARAIADATWDRAR